MRFLTNHTRTVSINGIILVCAMGVILSGCGRKLFPQPGGEDAGPQIRDLQAQVTARGVELSWSIPEKAAAGKYSYSVMKAEMKWENRNCPECPGIKQHEVHAVNAAAAEKTVASPQRKLQWLDSNVAAYNAYRYQVSIQDDKGHPLTLSNLAIAKVYPGPAAPANVAATAQPQGILVQWKPTAKDMQGHNLQGDLAFQVERMSGDKPWEKASPVLKANSYMDQGIASEQSYSYRVVPVLVVDNTNIAGEPSPIVLAKAPESVTPPPPNSVWVIPIKGALEVRWTETDGKTGGYHVYRREGKEIIRLTASPVQHPPFVDKNVKRNETYSYAVSAVSAQGNHKEGLLSKWVDMRALLLE